MERSIGYEIDGRKFEGVLVYDDTVAGRRPTILVQPDWKGVCPDAIEQAKTVAGRDYVVFVADMFGVGYGARPKTTEELMAASRAVHNDLGFTLAAGGKALEAMIAEGARLGIVDASKTAAIGYCFGGGLVLELARAGADLGAVVVVHVTYPNPVDPTRPCNIKGCVLMIHGAADPVTPRPAMDALEAELSAAGVPWQTVVFGSAVHSFTDTAANTPGRSMYDAALARRSYALLREFLAETL